MVFAVAVALVALYPVPSPLPKAKPGTVISSRPFTGGSALSSAASSTFVLYHTVSPTGRDVAVSGVISVPRGVAPPGGWPIVSWAHGTTGNAPQCAPSRSAKQNVEQTFLDGWVRAGYAVAQTDYEGEGTPGLHPYFASLAGAHDTTDIVRAARALDPRIGTRWIAMGHSEGGTVALFTAATAPSWASELHLLGTVAYAPVTDLTDVLGNITTSREPTPTLPLGMMMVEGIASTDPAIDLTRILSPRGVALLPQLQRDCVGNLMNSSPWDTVAPASLFQPNAPTYRLFEDFARNQPLNLPIHAPLLLEQGTQDQLVDPGLTDALRRNLQANGVPVTLDAIYGADHDTVMAQSFDRVKAWATQRFASR